MNVEHHVHVALPDGFADRLVHLAARLDRLPQRAHPLPFNREKDDIRRELVRLAHLGR